MPGVEYLANVGESGCTRGLVNLLSMQAQPLIASNRCKNKQPLVSAPAGFPNRPWRNGVRAADVRLWFVLDDFDGVLQRSVEMEFEIILPPRRNDPDHWECSMRDPDGYTLVVVRPDWSAGPLP